MYWKQNGGGAILLHVLHTGADEVEWMELLTIVFTGEPAGANVTTSSKNEPINFATGLSIGPHVTAQGLLNCL
jgi:hypothetical protein